MDQNPNSTNSNDFMRQFASTSLAEAIRRNAHDLHASVNQYYDAHPYGFHLDMVAKNVAEYADSLGIAQEDCPAVWFGAMFHDSIEDARLTYNDVKRRALRLLGNEEKALLATEIVYALTNEKGRTRAERADYRYYAGIRSTPYAPLVKLADRLANLTYSSNNTRPKDSAKLSTYRSELPHFLSALNPDNDSDPRFALPPELVARLKEL